MKKNKKGFTLVELMAVVVILIIILVFAIIKVRSTSVEARKKAVRANAISYIKNLKQVAGQDLVESDYLDAGYFTVEDLKHYGIKLSGTMPDNGYIVLSDYKVERYCLIYGDYEITDIDNEKTIKEGNCSKFTKEFDTYFYDNVISSLDNYEIKYLSTDTQSFTVPYTGKYVIQLWGASGQDYNYENQGGKGAYTAGFVTLNKGDVLYFNIGGKGSGGTGGYNGGANGGTRTDGTYYGGGGATDVRLVYGVWNDFDSLKSRIMVAAGGAGAGYYNGGIVGGAGGALVGLSGTQSGSGAAHTVATGGSQTDPGKTVNGGSSSSGFGYSYQPNTYGTGGGGGYYGGGSGNSTSSKVSAGAGGSSFISGHKGCDAITESSTSTEIVHTHQNKHYSNIVFTDTVMKSGNEEIPTHDNTGKMSGNTGNGYALISLIIVYNDDSNQDSNNADFLYKGEEQTFTAPKDGTYKLEAWGAQGGNGHLTYGTGGYGGYSVGYIHLDKNDKLYVNVGGSGITPASVNNVSSGGYNGGGSTYGWSNVFNGSGGGATSIATSTGKLSQLSSNTSAVVIVAGGGGGGAADNNNSNATGGSGGGIVGVNGAVPYNNDGGYGLGGSQDSGGSYTLTSNRTAPSSGLFGLGGDGATTGGSGGGGGYYGGGGGSVWGGSGGGSGYIANANLTNKKMYCYNCSESDDESTKTISTTCVSGTPTSECTKSGNGFARITLVE